MCARKTGKRKIFRYWDADKKRNFKRIKEEMIRGGETGRPWIGTEVRR
jgi:hypothetical protein